MCWPNEKAMGIKLGGMRGPRGKFLVGVIWGEGWGGKMLRAMRGKLDFKAAKFKVWNDFEMPSSRHQFLKLYEKHNTVFTIKPANVKNVWDDNFCNRSRWATERVHILI